MKTAKEKAIAEAYGENWETCYPWVDKDGFCTVFWNLVKESEREQRPKKHPLKWRPKSLSGTENNNGWTRIESESDLPKEIINCFIVIGGKVINTVVFYNPIDKTFFNNVQSVSYDKVTHYQPIVKPEKPIY